jgi:hypothetical protein
MYAPRAPRIESSPLFRAKRLSEVELGSLLLLGSAPDAAAGTALAVRADALSRRGELSEGVVRLSDAMARFERHGLDSPVIELGIEFVLEADLLSAAVRPPQPGDLLVSAAGTATGLLVGGAADADRGLLELATALVRPLADTAGLRLALAWQLVERGDRSRVLLRRYAPPPPAAELVRLGGRRYRGESFAGDED